ncbi:YciI family protein [Asticcacaulis sp. AC402]|uniref:YciI family protein n=1 Tax=Asticcacaulis sp. AC402 TaxID=1282361 RepID=UPI0004187D2D|nr:YciI family protein [Asticcacaulis sp. AC402]
MDFILLMHAKPAVVTADSDWQAYFERLGAAGVMRGGSMIGDGACFSQTQSPPEPTAHLDGYIRIETVDFETARSFLAGNPVYEAGGVVEIRELPRD